MLNYYVYRYVVNKHLYYPSAYVGKRKTLILSVCKPIHTFVAYML